MAAAAAICCCGPLMPRSAVSATGWLDFPARHIARRPKMYQSHLDIPAHIRRDVIGILQARLSESIDLDAQMKQAHWNVKGKDFYQLHLLFDKIHDEVEEFVDLVAERITALGGIADGRIQTAARASQLY